MVSVKAANKFITRFYISLPVRAAYLDPLYQKTARGSGRFVWKKIEIDDAAISTRLLV